jgi:hypothetical protein
MKGKEEVSQALCPLQQWIADLKSELARWDETD